MSIHPLPRLPRVPRSIPHIPHIPRAEVDPIDGAGDALALISLAISHPLADETVLIVLDGHRRGSVITVVSDTHHVDLSAILEHFCAASVGTAAAHLVVATVRPHGATLPGDIDRWLEASALTETFGLSLLEWFVIGPAGPECPRDLIGEPERW